MMDENKTPYEYFEGFLCIQARYLFSGDNMHPDSLQLISESGLRQKVIRKNVIRARVGCVGNPMLLSFASLPGNWRHAIVERWGKAPEPVDTEPLMKWYKRDGDAYRFFAYYRFMDNNTTLKDAEVEQLTINASVLNAMQTLQTERKKLRKKLNYHTFDVWETVVADVNAVRDKLGHTLPSSGDRLRRKLNEYKKNGFECLIHGMKGKENRRIVTDKHEQFLNDMFTNFHTKPNMNEVAELYEGFMSGYVEIVNTDTGEVYQPNDYKKIANSTIRRYLAKWENKIGTYLDRSGDRQKYMQLFKPYHRLLQPKYASSIISIDDRQPPFEYAPGKRLWFYNGIDLGSEAFICWVWGDTKEGIIMDFYRQMVRNYSAWGLPLPAELEGEMSLNSAYLNTFLKEGNMFQYVRIEANNARGKRIEQYYKPLRYNYEKKREGWLARPFALNEANQARGEKKIIIPFNDIVEGCLTDIENWNNTEHSKIKGMSRWEVFMKMQNPNLKPTNWRGILPYIGYKTQSSVNAGIMRFRNSAFCLGMNDYICVGDKLIQLMQQVEGCDIDIYWLDDINGEVLKAYIYMGDQFICEAIEQPGYNRSRIEQTPADMVNRELMSKYTTTIEQYGRRKRAELNKNIEIIDNRPGTISSAFSIPGRAPLNPPQGDLNTGQAKVLPPMPEPVPGDYVPPQGDFVKPIFSNY